MQNKHNISLILGFSIPILMIVFVAASIYIPGIFSQPKYNFLYVSDTYYGRSYYSVNEGKIAQLPQPTPDYYNAPLVPPQLYVHDVAANKSRPISYEEALKLDLDPNLKSPDGYQIERGRSGGGLLFYSNADYNSQYIVGNNVSKKLDLNKDSTVYSADFRFLGWIK